MSRDLTCREVVELLSDYLIRQLDTAWKLTSVHLDGLSTEDCLWRPASSGPQVHLPLRVFVFEVQERVAKRRGVKSVGVGAIFNATYEPVDTDKITDWEGCLSVPFLGGETPRYRKIRIRGIDHDGDPLDLEVEDFTARIFQHEVDHTDGHVYLDRMPDLKTLGYTIVL